MNAKIRANRIFKNEPRFVRTDSRTGTSAPEIGALGPQLWTYTNNEYHLPDVRIHFFGVAWGEIPCEKIVLYSEITRIEFTNEKQSTTLRLTLTNGNTFFLPVAGNDGKIFDSFTMHRFLQNVVSDYREFPQQWNISN
jgi:hypothetical protein